MSAMEIRRRPLESTPHLAADLHPVLRRVYAARGIDSDVGLGFIAGSAAAGGVS